MRITAEIEGLDCPVCAAKLERKINKIKGVSCQLNFFMSKIDLEYETIEQMENIQKVIKKFDKNIKFTVKE